MLSRAQNTFHHNPCLRGPVSSIKRKESMCVCTGFPSFKLDLPKGDQGCCVQVIIFGPRFWVCGDRFDPLSDRRNYERCEGAGKTAVSWECGLLSRVGEVVYLSYSEIMDIWKQASLTLFY